jgi:hypothetical protein
VMEGGQRDVALFCSSSVRSGYVVEEALRQHLAGSVYSRHCDGGDGQRTSEELWTQPSASKNSLHAKARN